MDLLQCKTCRQRFLVADAGDGSGWTCSECFCELELVARSVPGLADHIADALSARILQATH